VDTKSLVWVCMSIGSATGSYVPELWGAGFLSFSSLLLTAIGGILGIWIGYRIGTY